MTAALKQYFHLRSFLIGLGVVALIYILLFAYIGINGKKTIESLEQKLASDTVLIKRLGEEFDPAPALVSSPIANTTQEGQTPADENALAVAPISGLYKSSEAGLLPKISESGLTPYNGYKKPFSLPGKPLIAIAVLDYGLSSTNSASLLKDLPPEVTLLLSPYASLPNEWQKRARANGHEIWMQAPVDNQNFPTSDPGAQALLSQSGPKHNKDALNWILSRATGYAGVALYTDTNFKNNPQVLNATMTEIHKRGLGYFETNISAPDVASRFAASKDMPHLNNSIYIRNTSLKALEKIAKDVGFVVAIADPYPSSIKGLRIWAETLTTKGYALAPLSAITTLTPFSDKLTP